MFEYIKLKNFKSFENTEFNLLDKKNEPKKLILLYGENGIGKSNLASAFFMLSETLRTMDVRDIMQSILSQDPERLNNEDFSRFLKEQYKDIETLIKENKTVGSTDPMRLEFGFRINGKSGKYILETNDSQIIHEHLEFILIKNKGLYFDITHEKQTISSKIFKEKNAYLELKNACKKFWGKHSLLAIIMHESDDKADQYIADQISDNFKAIITFLSRISCKIKFGSRQERGFIGLPRELFANLEKGNIPEDKEETLDRNADMLTQLFKLTYKDIEKAYYHKDKENDRIKYKLMLSKRIAGKIQPIDFSLESTGTQSLVQQLPFMLIVAMGSVSVIDEFDTGIHDLLVKSLVTSLLECISGQLIMTTHNTLLMESVVPKECIYVIDEIKNGKKEINCITHYDPKIHENTNIRNQYMLGKYHGIPEKMNIDFRKLIKLLKKPN